MDKDREESFARTLADVSRAHDILRYAATHAVNGEEIPFLCVRAAQDAASAARAILEQYAKL